MLTDRFVIEAETMFSTASNMNVL